jgi:hypothetical protein
MYCCSALSAKQTCSRADTALVHQCTEQQVLTAAPCAALTSGGRSGRKRFVPLRSVESAPLTIRCQHTAISALHCRPLRVPQHVRMLFRALLILHSAQLDYCTARYAHGQGRRAQGTGRSLQRHRWTVARCTQLTQCTQFTRCTQGTAHRGERTLMWPAQKGGH